MSVSIDFCLEVRHDGKWSLLRWKQPMELMTYSRTGASFREISTTYSRARLDSSISGVTREEIIS